MIKGSYTCILDIVEVGDSPPSPTVYWVPKLKLGDTDRKQLVDGARLTDKHIDGSAQLLAQQFPDMQGPQSTLRGQQPWLLQPAKENSMFFHNFSGHWALSHLNKGVVYLYDSLQPKSLHTDLQQHMLALYGRRVVKVPSVQVQKGTSDCGCYAIAFCVSLLYGDDPATLMYNQKKMREQIVTSISNRHFPPFPATIKKSKRIQASVELTLDQTHALIMDYFMPLHNHFLCFHTVV